MLVLLNFKFTLSSEHCSKYIFRWCLFPLYLLSHFCWSLGICFDPVVVSCSNVSLFKYKQLCVAIYMCIYPHIPFDFSAWLLFPAINMFWRLLHRTETRHPLFHNFNSPPCRPFIMETLPASPLSYKYYLACVLLCLWNGFLEVGFPDPRASVSTAQYCNSSWGALLFVSLGIVRRRLILIGPSPELDSKLLTYCQSDGWEKKPPCTVLVRFSGCGSVWVTLMYLTLFHFLA